MNDPSSSTYPPLVVDMHAHYAMQWMPDFYWNGPALLRVALFGGTAKSATAAMVKAQAEVDALVLKEGVTPYQLAEARQRLLEKQQRLHIVSNRLKAVLISLANLFFNYASPWAGPAISPQRMKEGGVRFAFSVLVDPCDELLDESDKSPPWPSGTPFSHLEHQICYVQERVRNESPGLVWTPTPDETRKAIEEARSGGRIALIHCVEGGFHLGNTEDLIEKQVATLAKYGVAYVTLAHLLYRRLATCANALPIPDWAYHRWLPQEDVGLTDLGKYAVRQLAEKCILIDVCHMSKLAILDTLSVLDEFDKQDHHDAPTPVIATHMACRIGAAEYNLGDDTIQRIIARNGLLGVIVSRHWMRNHLKFRDDSWEDTCRVVGDHLERIRANGDSKLTCAAIGSDHDGFIKKALCGLEHPGKMKALSSWIESNYHDEAEGILSGNALRILQQVWQQP